MTATETNNDVFANINETIPEVEARRHRSTIHVFSDTEISETNPETNVVYVCYSRDMTKGYHSVWAVPGTL